MRSAIFVIIISCCMWSSSRGQANTIHVSIDGTPQNDGSSWDQSISDLAVAGQLAQNGDTILVSNGVYTSEGVHGENAQNVICVTTGVTLRSVNGYETTTINGGDSNRCVYMLGNNTVLDGFTITGGRAYKGGGVITSDKGAISHCYICNNVTTNGAGGGLYMYGGSLVSSRVESNSSYYGGGGLSLWGESTSTGYVYDTIFRMNQTSAGIGGGGFYARYAIIDRCIIENNKAKVSSDGGGVCLYFDTSILRNSLIVSNESVRYGGGVHLSYRARMENCTVAWNKGYYGAGGVYCRDTTNYCINSVIYNNTNTIGTASNYEARGSGYLSFTNCCMAPLANGTNNIDADPLLENGGLQLTTNSPCINAGLTMSWMNSSLDLIGNPRMTGDTVDIGAIEYFSGNNGGALSGMFFLLFEDD